MSFSYPQLVMDGVAYSKILLGAAFDIFTRASQGVHWALPGRATSMTSAEAATSISFHLLLLPCEIGSVPAVAVTWVTL